MDLGVVTDHDEGPTIDVLQVGWCQREFLCVHPGQLGNHNGKVLFTIGRDFAVLFATNSGGVLFESIAPGIHPSRWKIPAIVTRRCT